MELPLSMSPKEIIDQYNLKDLVAADSYVYMEIIKGMPGLKQAGRLARNWLTKNLARNGYAPIPHTLSLWRHHTSDLVFSLVIDDFGIKYTRKADADHLLKSLQEDYEIIEEWTGEKSLGLTLKWNYVIRNVSVSIQDMLKQPSSSSKARPPPNPKMPHTGGTRPHMAPKSSMPTPTRQT